MFIHLRLHTAYSLAEGAIKIKEAPKLCHGQNMPAIAMTDSMNLFGALEFSLACAYSGVQPIIGCQIRLKNQDHEGLMVLIAQSELGYKNLIRLVSDAYFAKDPAEDPIIHLSALTNHTDGIIALTGGADGLLGTYLDKDLKTDARNFVRELLALFPNRLYIELERHGLAKEERLEPLFLELADSFDIPLVATNNVYFAKSSMHEAHDVLLCIAQGATVSQHDRKQVTAEHYFKSSEEMAELFADIPEAIQNTVVIAQRCGFMPTEQKPMLPPFKTESGRTEAEEMRFQAYEGLKKRLNTDVIPQEYCERLEEEIGIIDAMGFPGYFLIVADFIKWAKSQNIPVGPGRGSGAGSLVAWSLTITDIDPIRHGLIFERFLNPERVSMPDFDVDFCQDRRDEVIRYVCDKYGYDYVAHIITFGKLQARAALRDVGRVLEMPYPQVDRICKLIPSNPANPVTISQALEMEPLLKQAQAEDPQVAKLLEIATQLEGLYRHASTHAAGVVIGGNPLVETIPMYKDERSALAVTQFSMKYVEAAGLLKFDFLGLKTLSVIQKCCDILAAKGTHINISTIPLDDPKTFAYLQKVETVGIFQLESGGMRDVLRKLRPDRFEDLVALVALYRPGPMDDIPRYLACKHGEEEIRYLHPALEPVLEATYGVMVYQEQVMKIAQVLGGYSLGGADILRRAMGKKIKEEMDAQRAKFVDGAVHKGVSQTIASQIFDAMAKFASYGFNKSHSAPYALITYQTAYLKANYPKEFMAASMTFEMDNTDKLMIFRQELQRMDIPVLPPCINHSGVEFQVEGDSIRYALAAIKNVGQPAMHALVTERRQNGPYQSIEDICSRLDTRVINKRLLEGLIAAGAFDALSPNRRQLFDGVDSLIKFCQSANDVSRKRQGSLFDNLAGYEEKISLPKIMDWDNLSKLRHEFQALGFFLSAHPLEACENALKKRHVATSLQAFELGDGALRVAGVVLAKQERTSKTGQKFAFVQCSDAAGFFEVAVFSETFTRCRAFLEPGKLLMFQVGIRRDGETVRLTAQDIQPLDQVLKEMSQQIEIRVHPGVDLNPLKHVLSQAKSGPTKVQIFVPLTGKKPVIIKLPQSLTVDTSFRSQIASLPSVESVIE